MNKDINQALKIHRVSQKDRIAARPLTIQKKLSKKFLQVEVQLKCQNFDVLALILAV
jgi:hypothetical protein